MNSMLDQITARLPALRTLALCTLLLSTAAPAAFAQAPRTLWQFNTLKSAETDSFALRGVHPIRFERESLDDWQTGEPGQMLLPSGRSFEIVAERTVDHASGNRTWIGKYDADGRTYVAIVTYGPAGVAGEVRTPDGHVLLQSEGGRTVLVDTEEAGWQIPIPTESDIRVPEEPVPLSSEPGRTRSSLQLKALPSPQTVIDVLIAYTNGMVIKFGSVAGVQLRLDQLIATSNQAYIDSEVAITVRLVHALEVAYTETDNNSVALDNLTNGLGVFSSVQGTLRNRYGADIVALVRPFNYPAQVGCGIAWLGGYNGTGASIGSQSTAGFAVVSDGSDVNGSGYFCQNASFAHELGHTMGAMHDRATVTQGGTTALQTGAYSYSYGYVHDASFSSGSNVCNGSGTCFGTIMSYLNKVSELKFSNPNILTCPAGLSCGTATDNVALTLNNTRTGVASWRATKVPFVGATSGSGQNAVSNSSFAQPLLVTIRDATNQIVPGVVVNFAVPASGASATLSATSVVTDANGVAQVAASANGASGSYVVTATAMSGLVGAPFSFNLSNGSAAASLTVSVRGNGTVTGGGVNCPGSCVATPAGGSTVTLNASPAAGMVFTGWLGETCTGTGTCAVTMNRSATVSATFAPTGTLPARFDIDLNQRYDALTDGVLVMRYLFGISGSALIGGAVGSGAQRTSASTIETYLGNISPQFDVDGDGRADALTDGVMIMRYLFGLRGSALINGMIGAGATRFTSAQIEAYIAARLP